MVEGTRAFFLVAWMWVRSSLTYRASFLITTLANLAITFLDFVVVLLMFSHVDALGGFGLAEVALLYGSASLALGVADLLLGNVERVGERIRDGSLDVLLVRPVSIFVQVAADRFALRRLGRVIQALGVLGWALPRVDVEWSAGAVALLVMMLVSGSVIFGAVFVLGSSFQFWAQDAAQVQNAFTYGGGVLLQYPPTIFPRELVRGVTFVLPLAFVNWLPALRLLGRDDPLGLPGWVDFLSPLVALVLSGLTALVWRSAVRSYRSTGS
ncbi:ABC-2 type transport system permease protein [Streptomyces zhaozhouensis]|uniref:ABC-2 type transport system permease protein n=1 Tax=Streptomyces zhaozhouensis TaxID=1300267 RepID=A0A286EAM4_9ACTN|nr:ABC transporter permease [Streptomyces zhaozhouensis]SOD67995.1 ABC-2 type transport system permease protein [Streptomyces zhaozhouensis]